MKPVEALTLVPLGALVVVFGLFPGLLLDLIQRLRRRPPSPRVGARAVAGRACGPVACRSRAPLTAPRHRRPRAVRRRDPARRRDPRRRLHLRRAATPAGAVVTLRRAGASSARSSRSAGAAARATAFGGAYVVDGLTTFLDLLFVSIVAFTIVFAPDYLEARGLPLAEFAVVLVFAMTGAMLIAGSADLLVLFLALELWSCRATCSRATTRPTATRPRARSSTSSSARSARRIFLFGLAFTWGLTGTTSIDGVGRRARRGRRGDAALSPALGLGLGFLTTGVAFKIAAVPFHYWTPDAYQGSPTPVTGYLSVGPKIGAFALILRLFVEALGPLAADWLRS